MFIMDNSEASEHGNYSLWIHMSLYLLPTHLFL